MVGIRHVGINAVFLQPRMGGLDTLTQELVPELVRQSPATRFSVFLSAVGKEYVREAGWASEVDLVTHPLLGRPGLKAVTEMSLLGVLADRRGVDVLHSLAMTAPLRMRAANVVTVADVLWMEEPTGSPATDRLWRLVVPRIARSADRVVAISAAGGADIVRLLGVDPRRVDVVAPGARPPEGGSDGGAEDRLRRSLDVDAGPIVLSASAMKPYKNLARLIEAWPEVLAAVPDACLVLPGAPTPHQRELRSLAGQLDVAHAVRFPGFVERRDLAAMYRAATCFVFPSLREGFGLPVVEAMHWGLPVACSQAPALPEVGGEAVLYFDPHQPAAIAGAVRRLLTDAGLRGRLAAAGREQAARFTWERAAQQTLDVYERARLSARRRR